MEFIRVHFAPDDVRDVVANGNIVGATETELTVPPNYYVVSLSGAGYAPAFWYGLVSDTSPAHPLPIRFSKL